MPRKPTDDKLKEKVDGPEVESGKSQAKREGLEESEETFRTLAEQSPNMIFINHRGKVVYANKRCEEIMGYTREEICSPDFDFLALIAPESLEQVKASFGRHMKGEEVEPYEYGLLSKDGKRIDGIITTKLIDYKGEQAILGIVTDITERKRLEAQLAQAQKMEAIATMASGVAHNFRNVLAVISMQSQIVQMKYKDDSELQGIAQRINNYVDRGAKLVDGLMRFSRRQTKKEFQPVDLAQVIRETYQLISISFDKLINIRIRIPESLPMIGDHAELSQVLMNIYTNARDAMPKGGELRIEGGRQGGQAVVVISDTGHGMDQEIRQRCFDPFFTTKELNKGTGLGLSTSYGIVKEHGGEIQVHSRPGQGSTFKLLFPLAPADRDREEEPPAQMVLGRGQRVLIVDDEVEICKVMKSLLETLGYQAAYVCSATEGIAMYRSWQPDAVLLDRNMPNMDGISCAAKLRDLDPDAKILIISGYEEVGPSGIGEEGKRLIRGYLTKPVRLATLSSTLAQVLE